MKAANLAMADGVKLTETQYGLLGRASRVLADQTGGDTKVAFETLLNVMAGGKTMALKSIGVTIDQKKAQDDYAATLRKSTGDLTDNEKKIANQNAILAALQGRLKQTGDAQDDFADAVAHGTTFFQNFNDDLSVGIANSPVLTAALGSVQTAMDTAFGGDQQGMIKKIVGLLEDGAIRLADFAQVGIWGAGMIGRAYSALQLVFAGVMGGIASNVADAARQIAGLATAASGLPGGAALRGIALAAADVTIQARGMRKSFEEQTAEAWKGVKGE